MILFVLFLRESQLKKSFKLVIPKEFSAFKNMAYENIALNHRTDWGFLKLEHFVFITRSNFAEGHSQLLQHDSVCQIKFLNLLKVLLPKGEKNVIE